MRTPKQAGPGLKQLLIAVILLTTLISSSYAACWNLVWSDEFDGPNINTNNWNFDTGCSGWGNSEWENYTNNASNAYIENGNLVIQAVNTGGGSCGYTSARMTTSGKVHFTYGRIEARIKIPYGQGMWPAFWMLGQDISSGVNWPGCGEIDIMEMVGGGSGRDNVTYGTAHWDNNGHASYGLSTSVGWPAKLSDDYHIYAVEWDANQIRWYFDSNNYCTLNTNGASMEEFVNKDFFILLNVAVGGQWPGYPDGTTVFPQKMYVDYVRWYQDGACGPTNTPSPTPTLVTTNIPGNVQFEDYANGGEGVSYYDTTAGNTPGQYRNDDVDIEACSEAGGGYDLAYTAAGEWLNYSINVQQAGNYSIGVHVASLGPGGIFHLELDGVNISGALTVPDTGGWQTWQTLTVNNINIGSTGLKTLKLVMDTNGATGSIGNLNYVSFTTAGYTSTPTPTFTPTFTVTTIPPVCSSWVVNGSAFSAGTGVTLTTAVNSQAGSAWNSTCIDLTNDFNKTFKVYLGAPGGADGVDFVLQRDARGTAALGLPGGAKGYGLPGNNGITPSVAFDLETWGSNGTLQVLENGDPANTCTNAGSTCPYVFPSVINNGFEHTYQVVWSASAQKLTLIMDGSVVMVYNRDLAAAVFGGNSCVYYGFTAATGGINTLQYVYETGCSAAATATPTQIVINVPGRVECENYMNGGEGAAYNDTTTGNTPGQYRTDDVDIEACTDAGGGYDLSYTAAGEWENYRINVATSDTYNIDVRVASQGAGGTFHIEADGVNVSGAMTVPDTTGWQKWQTLSKSGVVLPAGLHTLKLVMDTNGATGSIGNFNYIDVISQSATPTITPTPAGSDVLIPLAGGKTMTCQFINNTGNYADSQIYVIAIGLNAAGKYCHLDASGNMIPCVAGDNAQGYFIQLSTINGLQFPDTMISVRLYIALGAPLNIVFNTDINGNVGIAYPSIDNPGDPSYNSIYDWEEFNLQNNTIFLNSSQVDMFGIPTQLRLYDNGTPTYTLNGQMGIPYSMAQIASDWAAQVPAEFQHLYANGRIVAPIHGLFGAGKTYANYFDTYINSIWSQYSSSDLVLSIGGSVYTGRVGGDTRLAFTTPGDPVTYYVSKPTTQDAFMGAGTLASGNGVEKQLEAQICAAFNRHILQNISLANTSSAFYQASPANWYAKFWHDHSINHLAYGFCYDDVSNQSTTLVSTNPRGMVVVIGAGNTTPTKTVTAVNTATRTATATVTATITGTYTQTPTFTRTITCTATGTPVSLLLTATVTASYTATAARTSTQTPAAAQPSVTSTSTPAATNTGTAVFTATNTPTHMAATFTATATGTNRATSTATSTGQFTATGTPASTNTVTPAATLTRTPVNSFTATAANTAVATMQLTATRTFTPTNTVAQTQSYTSTATKIPTITTTTVPSSTSTPTATLTGAQDDKLEIKDPVAFPNPNRNIDEEGIKVRFDLTKNASLIKFRLYTVGYRAVRAVTFTSDRTYGSLLAGTNEILIEGRYFANLAQGIYYYLLSAEDDQGNKVSSKLETIVIVR